MSDRLTPEERAEARYDVTITGVFAHREPDGFLRINVGPATAVIDDKASNVEVRPTASGVSARDRAVAAKALRDAADDMGDTDDPDAIHVANGDVDVWLRARADRIEAGEQLIPVAYGRPREPR